MTRVLRVTIDADRCDGHALCEDAAPDVVTVGDDDVAEVVADPVPEGQRSNVERAVQMCPKGALRIIEEES
jgi:ferredoxin